MPFFWTVQEITNLKSKVFVLFLWITIVGIPCVALALSVEKLVML
jgi:hypothetical protein